MAKTTQRQASPSLKTDPSKPLGLVLSGGGARGAFQVGVWEVLHSHPKGLKDLPDVISGTSAGALNGAFIAAGLSADEMLDFWMDLAEDPPVLGNDSFFQSLVDTIQGLLIREPLRSPKRRRRELRSLARLFQKHRWYRGSGMLSMFVEFLLTARFDNISHVLENIKATYLFDTSPVRERLKKTLGSHSLRNTKTKLAINTVDVHTGEVVRLVNASPKKHHASTVRHYREVDEITIDMLLASAAIPLLFKPIEVHGITMWDGGLLVNTPLAPAVALGATRIIPVLVTLSDFTDVDTPQVLPSFGSAVERLANTFLENAYNIDRKLLLERNELAKYDKDLSSVELFCAIRPTSQKLFNAGSYLYFEPHAIQSMYEAGKQAAIQWLADGPEMDWRERKV